MNMLIRIVGEIYIGILLLITIVFMLSTPLFFCMGYIIGIFSKKKLYYRFFDSLQHKLDKWLIYYDKILCKVRGIAL